MARPRKAPPMPRFYKALIAGKVVATSGAREQLDVYMRLCFPSKRYTVEVVNERSAEVPVEQASEYTLEWCEGMSRQLCPA